MSAQRSPSGFAAAIAAQSKHRDVCRSRSTTRGGMREYFDCFRRWGGIVTTTRLRCALGICISAALLVGSFGGAIALADSDSGDSVADTKAVDISNQSVSSTTESVGSTPDKGVTDSPITSGQEEPTSSTGPMTMAAATDTQEPAPTDTHEVVTTVAEQHNQGSGSTTVVTTQVASSPDVVISHSTVVVPPPAVVTSKSSAPTVNRRMAVRTAVAPVIKSVATLANAIGSIPAVVASLPSSPTPVTDVITAVQDVLTSVAGVGASLARLPSELASLLGFPGMAPSAIGRGLHGAGVSAASQAPMRSSSVVPSPLPVTSAHRGVPSTGNVARHPTLVGVATTGVSEALSVSEVAPVVPEAVVPTGVLSSIKHTISAVLGPASLAALAAAGLPGIGGLLIISAAGMVVGYRQAKAAATLRAVGIARFARLGPLGVVRSGSLVAVRPRASRVRDQHSGAERLLESVA